MKSFYNKYIYFLFLIFSSTLVSCVDDALDPNGSEIPDDLKEGFTITFQFSLDPMGGAEFRTRATSDMRDIEDFVDLEKLRILFFTCTDEEADKVDEAGTSYESGVHDIFLFESTSRWVTELESSSSNASKLWQVTAPVFSYGNQDLNYNWPEIRKALMTKRFKIAILANRPGAMRYGDFDKSFEKTFFFGNRGPYWGPEDSWAFDGKNEGHPTVNDLHHCQWDPVYTNKNLIAGISGSGGVSNGVNVYDFIIGKPVQDTDSVDGKTQNLMGAVSAWTEKVDEKGQESNDNYYFHPSKKQGIPMYGIQKFEPIVNWAPGTPFNVSESKVGQDNKYDGRTISLLRSLVRLDLMIPKTLGGKNIVVSDVKLHYSNVMSRCEPLDVATPTHRLWSNDACNPDPNIQNLKKCEWFMLQEKALIINKDLGEVGKNNFQIEDAKKAFEERTAWFYGAWIPWWWDGPKEGHLTSAVDKNSLKFGNPPYPHIYNPCTQRNSVAYLQRTKVEDNAYFYYIVYTGERNINDPSNFRNLNISNAKIAYFEFQIKYEDDPSSVGSKTYYVALTDYGKNKIITNSNYNYTTSSSGSLESGDDPNDPSKVSYRTRMSKSLSSEDWNWVLLRNHIYRFQIHKIDGNLDDGGFDGLVISTEDRSAPDITYE